MHEIISIFAQNANQANNVQNEVSNRHQNQDQITQKQTQPQQQQQQQPKAQPKAKPRKMDLSEYDTANDDIISASNAPESAVTSDERVKFFPTLIIKFNECWRASSAANFYFY